MLYPSELEDRFNNDFKDYEKTNKWFNSSIIKTLISNLNSNNHLLVLQDQGGVQDEAIFRNFHSDEPLSTLNPDVVFFELESQRIFPFHQFHNKILENTYAADEELPLCFYRGLEHKAFKINRQIKLSKQFKTYGDLPEAFIQGIQSGEITINPIEDDALKTEGFINNIAKICNEMPNKPFTFLVLGHFKDHYAAYVVRVSEDDRCEIISLNSLSGYNDTLFINALKKGIKKGLGFNESNFEPTLSGIVKQSDWALCGVVASCILGCVDHNKPLKDQFEHLKKLMKGVIDNKKSVRKLLARIAWWKNAVAFRKTFENDQWKYVEHFSDEQSQKMKSLFLQLLYHTCKIEPPGRCDLVFDPALYEEYQRFLNLFGIKINDEAFLKLFNKYESSENEDTDSTKEADDISFENIEPKINQFSDDIKIQKQQLQTALGLYASEEIITKYNHPAPNIALQKALIEKLKDEKEFLTDILREFVYRGLGFHDPCDQTEATIELLLNAGADPHTDHFSMNYVSPSLDFAQGFAGQSTLKKIQDSTYSNRSLEAVIKNIPDIPEDKQKNSTDIMLVNLLHVLMAKYPNQKVMLQIIDDLEKQDVKLENLNDKLNEIINNYFPEIIKLEDNNPIKLKLNTAIDKVKLFINQRYYFIHNLKSYAQAYQNPTISDEECIQFISEDNEIAKKQLQIALGVGVNEEIPGLRSGRLVRQHQNTRLTLQAKLIEVISKNPENQAFLSSVLRDFIIRPCDSAQIPCPNASQTVQMLVNAGADPTVDHIDKEYNSPGRSFNNYNAGMTLIEIVQIWGNRLSEESNAENALILETIRAVQNKEENTDEITLYNLIHQIEYINASNHNNHIPLAEKIADYLIENYEDIESMTELFETVKKKYFQRELNDENQSLFYLKAIDSTKEFLVNRKLYQQFKQAYENDWTDDECIEFMSKDPNTLKQQLQLALGLTTPQGEHLNQHLNLQEALINEIRRNENNQEYLSNLLRDFIFFVCEGGKSPCQNADITMKLLIDAGADPTITGFNYHYKSDHKDQLKFYNGIPAVFELDKWADNKAVKKMRALAKQNASITYEHYFHYLLQVISLSHDKSLSSKRRDYLKQLAASTARNFITTGLQTTDLAGLINEAKNDRRDQADKNKANSYREAEGLLLEAIYQKEHKEEHRLLRMIKFSLIFSPLILPLIFTAIVAIVREIKLKKTTFTVSAEDISLEKFKEKFKTRDDFADISEDKIVTNMKDTYSTEFPVKENGKLRKAVVFNSKFSQSKWVKSHKKDAKLPGIFSGTSTISDRDEAKLKKDIRIYRPKIH